MAGRLETPRCPHIILADAIKPRTDGLLKVAARQHCAAYLQCANDLTVAELFPGAEVVAMDISPIQPVFAPPNLTTRLADIETDWECHMQSDLVHLERVAPYLRRPKDLLAKILA